MFISRGGGLRVASGLPLYFLPLYIVVSMLWFLYGFPGEKIFPEGFMRSADAGSGVCHFIQYDDVFSDSPPESS
jgi:hypothetical protein